MLQIDNYFYKLTSIFIQINDESLQDCSDVSLEKTTMLFLFLRRAPWTFARTQL